MKGQIYQCGADALWELEIGTANRGQSRNNAQPKIAVSHGLNLPCVAATARIDLVDEIEGFYKSQRVHSSIDFQVPRQLERQLKAA